MAEYGSLVAEESTVTLDRVGFDTLSSEMNHIEMIMSSLVSEGPPSLSSDHSRNRRVGRNRVRLIQPTSDDGRTIPHPYRYFKYGVVIYDVWKFGVQFRSSSP